MHYSDIVNYIFFTCIFIIAYVYVIYGLLIRLLSATKRFSRQSSVKHPNEYYDITVLLTVHNEEKNIASRLDNLLEQNYPEDKYNIIVASDGSTDMTDGIIKEYTARHKNIKLIQTGDQLGKSATQNRAMKSVQSEIVALTDCETVFKDNYIMSIANAFKNPVVGCVTAELLFEDMGTSISQSQGYYWTYELMLRRIESNLGILAVASGQAMAFRRSIFIDLPPDVGDDCIIPLDTVASGMKVIHSTDAIAYDRMESTPSRELGSRIRMTLRNWNGTWRRPELLNPLHHPGYAFSLWSHKILRWIGGPILYIGLFIGPIASITSHTYPWAIALESVFLLLLLPNVLRIDNHVKIPFSGSAFSFMLANTGFAIGLYKALSGKKITVYKPGNMNDHSSG